LFVSRKRRICKMEIMKCCLIVVCALGLTSSNPFNLFNRKYRSEDILSPRQGRNSKHMLFGDRPRGRAARPLSLAEPQESDEEERVEESLADARLVSLEDEVTELLMNDILQEIQDQETKGALVTEEKFTQTTNKPEQSPVYKFKQPTPTVYRDPVQGVDKQVQPLPNQPFYPEGFTAEQYEQFKQFQKQQAQLARTPFGSAQPRSTGASPTVSSGVSSNFGPNMGADAIADPDNNQYPNTPQLERLIADGSEPVMRIQELDQNEVGLRQNEGEGEEGEGGEEEEGEEEEGGEVNTQDSEAPEAPETPEAPEAPEAPVNASGEEKDDIRCVNKVMQVEETVYEERIKCTHKFTEKCHDTFITDYIPTQQEHCEESFDKQCRITYKPMMFTEDVELCNEPLQKVCSEDTIGLGEEVCKTHYETNCETRFKEHEVEQDEPVCEMVTERRCNGVNVPLPDNSISRRRRQAFPQLNGGQIDNNQIFSNLGFLQGQGDVVSIGEECEEWPVQKCRLEKKLVKKINPETACSKIPREICAPSNCIIKQAEKVCQTESRDFVQNIPSEDCHLEPQEDCKMETVLVPRLVKKPNCIKVPKEICVNARVNPKKVKRPVIKEWCYRPSDLENQSSRLALNQFFKQ